MYKDNTENIEIYFICYKKKEMNLVETFYDEVLDIHYWYFNAYLAYQKWLKGFEGLELTELAYSLLVVAASRYLIYCSENEEFTTDEDKKQKLKDLKRIQKELKKIMNANHLLEKLC